MHSYSIEKFIGNSQHIQTHTHTHTNIILYAILMRKLLLTRCHLERLHSHVHLKFCGRERSIMCNARGAHKQYTNGDGRWRWVNIKKEKQVVRYATRRRVCLKSIIEKCWAPIFVIHIYIYLYIYKDKEKNGEI